MLNQSPSDGTLSNKNTYRKGHQAGDTWMGMRGKIGAHWQGNEQELCFQVQPSCLACCALIPLCQA